MWHIETEKNCGRYFRYGEKREGLREGEEREKDPLVGLERKKGAVDPLLREKTGNPRSMPTVEEG